jgi:lipoprotein-releasing system permease protein
VYKLFLTLRYLRKRRIAYFAIAAVMLCVAMVLIVLSVMGGWLEMVKRQARGLLGDIIVDNRAYAGFPLYQEFIDEISRWPEIVKATPVLYTYGLFHFRSTDQTGAVRVVGIRLDEVYEVNAFKNSLFYEKYYPGTTTLAEQRQPVLGPDPDAEPLTLQDEQGHPVALLYRPKLPEPYQQALERFRQQAGGNPASEEFERPLNELLAKAGLPPIPGWYEEGDEPGLVGEPYPGLILGRDLVAKRHSDGRYERYYPRGEVVTLTLWATSARGQVDPIPIKRAFRYADDSRTGIYDIDSQHVYCDFDLLQKLLQMDATPRVDQDGNVIGMAPARCAQIQIRIAPGVDAKALTSRLRDKYLSFLDDPRFDLDLTDRRLISRIEALTWQESQAHIIAPVEKEKILVTILFGIISLVAVALILCILYMIVLQKTRDIGIIKAIGGSSGGVAGIFVIYGAAVGLTGAVLGTALGTLVVTYINEIQDFLVKLNPAWRVWDLSVYAFDRIPNEVNPVDALVVALCAVVAATAGSLAAAWRAGTMQPVEAIRYE